MVSSKALNQNQIEPDQNRNKKIVPLYACNLLLSFVLIFASCSEHSQNTISFPNVRIMWLLCLFSIDPIGIHLAPLIGFDFDLIYFLSFYF